MTESGNYPARLGTVTVLGGFEISDWPEDSDSGIGATDTEYSLIVNFLIIRGGRVIIGWPQRAFEGIATISLAGTVDSAYYSNPAYTSGTVSSKAIGKVLRNSYKFPCLAMEDLTFATLWAKSADNKMMIFFLIIHLHIRSIGTWDVKLRWEWQHEIETPLLPSFLYLFNENELGKSLHSGEDK